MATSNENRSINIEMLTYDDLMRVQSDAATSIASIKSQLEAAALHESAESDWLIKARAALRHNQATHDNINREISRRKNAAKEQRKAEQREICLHFMGAAYSFLSREGYNTILELAKTRMANEVGADVEIAA